MNILYIVNHLNVGGITSYCLTLANGMKKKGHNVFIASGGGELLSNFKDAGVSCVSVPLKTKKEISFNILFSFFRLSKIIRDNKIDILHSNSRTTQVLGCLLQRSTGVKHIFTCHGFFKRRFLRRVFPCWGDKIIAISQQVREHLEDDFGVPSKDIVVINNGIDIERFSAEAIKPKAEIRNRLGLGAGPVVGIIARLSDVKGHKYLIEAMSLVLTQSPQAQLLIIGEGKMQEELFELVNKLGINKSVVFIAKSQDTRDILSVIDVFVMPSLQEGLGLALMEAMASGLAVVGSNVGGIRTLIESGSRGLLVEPADAKSLAAAISKLLNDKPLRENLGSQARKFIQNNFSQTKMVLETEKEYLGCLKIEN